MRAPRPSWVQTPALESLGDRPPATLLEWLCARFPRIAPAIWQQRLKAGLVTDERERSLTVDAPFVPRQRIRYFREVPEEVVNTEPIPILYRDDQLIGADKPPFIPVTPSGPYVRRCLLYRLVEQLGIEGLTPIHRLDRATSGVVLFAPTAPEAAPFAALFASGALTREYEALAYCPKRPDQDRWEIENRLVTGTPFFRMQTESGPPNAQTTLELLDWRAGVVHFRLTPRSGKQHQLRVHLANLGWPILGERYYPDLQPERRDNPTDPLRLVARSLTFLDPRTGVKRRIVSRWRVRLESRELQRSKADSP